MALLVNKKKQRRYDKKTLNNRLKDAEEVVDAVCDVFFVTKEDIKSKLRLGRFVYARHAICGLLRERKVLISLQHIGYYFLGERHHSTVISSINVHNDLCFCDKRYKAKINSVKRLLDNKLALAV